MAPFFVAELDCLIRTVSLNNSSISKAEGLVFSAVRFVRPGRTTWEGGENQHRVSD